LTNVVAPTLPRASDETLLCDPGVAVNNIGCCCCPGGCTLPFVIDAGNAGERRGVTADTSARYCPRIRAQHAAAYDHNNIRPFQTSNCPMHFSFSNRFLLKK
jgi:hypothetical protein